MNFVAARGRRVGREKIGWNNNCFFFWFFIFLPKTFSSISIQLKSGERGALYGITSQWSGEMVHCCRWHCITIYYVSCWIIIEKKRCCCFCGRRKCKPPSIKSFLRWCDYFNLMLDFSLAPYFFTKKFSIFCSRERMDGEWKMEEEEKKSPEH